MSTRRSSRNGLSAPPVEDAIVNAAAAALPLQGNRSSRPRLTPRNSTSDEAITTADKETPYATLRQLANLPKPTTPLHRASSVGPPTTRRTPFGQDRTPGRVPPPGSSRRPTVLTPYGRAAVKGVELYRANAITPAKDRRRSGRQQQRDTPLEALRALSRLLAPSTKPILSSPESQAPAGGNVLLTGRYGDDSEEALEPRPRLSMPLVEDEDDSLLLPPLHSAGMAEDENFALRSLEFPRRAVLPETGGRLSRGSFGSLRTSDRLENFNEVGLDVTGSIEDESTFIPQGDFVDYDRDSVGGETIGNLQRPYIDDDSQRVSLASDRVSDILLRQALEDESETAFVLPLPRRDSTLAQQSLDAGSEPSEDEDQHKDSIARNELEDIENSGDSDIDQVRTEKMGVDNAEQAQLEIVSGGLGKVYRTKKRIKVSRYGIQYPSLPGGVIKRLATTFLRTSGSSSAKLSKDALEAIILASDWFFEQISDDLSTYAEHAGRKTIDENDVFTLMKRQRQTSATVTPFALAQRHLPRELLQELRMAQPSKLKRGRQLQRVEEEEEEEEEGFGEN